jgi:hypothetical protein
MEVEREPLTRWARGHLQAAAAPSALHAAVRVAIGVAVSGVVVEGTTRVVRVAAQSALQLVAGRKATLGSHAGGEGVARSLRAAAMELVVLARAASFGFAVSYAAPAVFAAVRV